MVFFWAYVQNTTQSIESWSEGHSNGRSLHASSFGPYIGNLGLLLVLLLEGERMKTLVDPRPCQVIEGSESEGMVVRTHLTPKTHF